MVVKFFSCLSMYVAGAGVFGLLKHYFSALTPT